MVNHPNRNRRQRVARELADDLLPLCEALIDHFDMEDGPCDADGVCAAWICQESGCVKDKAARARAALVPSGESTSAGSTPA